MSFVQTHVSDGIGVLTLDDPDKRNALNLAMNDEIAAVLDRWEHGDEVRAIVVTGAGSAFCAGADLGDLLASSNSGALHEIYRGFLRVAHSPLPTIAAVNGAAVGAGMNMALACDVIVAARRARFDARFPQIGLHPGGGHTWRLREKTSDQVARAMLLFGEILDGARAAEVGLAWRVVDDDALLDVARELAGRAAAVTPRLLRSIKNTIGVVRTVTDSVDAVERELGPQVNSIQSAEFRALTESLRASISSRPADGAPPPPPPPPPAG